VKISPSNIVSTLSSVGSWLGASGTNSYTIARALGHQSVKSGEVYVRLGADSVRDAMQAVQRARPLLDAAVNDANTDERFHMGKS
jgi:hypothetical protein